MAKECIEKGKTDVKPKIIELTKAKQNKWCPPPQSQTTSKTVTRPKLNSYLNDN